MMARAASFFSPFYSKQTSARDLLPDIHIPRPFVEIGPPLWQFVTRRGHDWTTKLAHIAITPAKDLRAEARSPKGLGEQQLGHLSGSAAWAFRTSASSNWHRQRELRAKAHNRDLGQE